MLRSIFLCAALAMPAVFTALPADAAQTDSAALVTVAPSDQHGNSVGGPGYYVITARPATTTRLYAKVTMERGGNRVISVAAVDATSGTYGGVVMNPSSGPRHVVGSWMRLSTHQVRIKKHQARVVSFTVHVPAHTHAGQYIGGITALIPAAKKPTHRGYNVRVQTRVAVAVVVNVPGKLHPRLAVSGVTLQSRPRPVVTVRLQNAGNALLKGRGHIWMWRIGQSNAVLSKPLTIDTTVPHTAVPYPIMLQHALRTGRYTYKVKVRWTGGAQQKSGKVQVPA